MKSILSKLLVLQILGCIAGVGILYHLLDYTLTRDERAQFYSHGRTIAEAVASACESPLIAHDLTSVQSVLDASLQTRGVEWAYVTGPDGSVVAHTFVPEFPQELLDLRQETLQAGVRSPGLTGQKTVSTFRAPVLTGIVGNVHIGINQEDLVGAVRHAERVALGSLLAVFLALILVLALSTRHIIAPIHQLTRAARRLAEDVRVEVPQLRIYANDEIGVLTAAFNRMANDVRQSHDRLEARVAERTAELAAANAVLQSEILERQHAEQALREGEAQLHHLALHDALTGLPNRLLFLDRLGGAILRAQRAQTAIAVMFVDLDNFKIINDSMGHEAGDTLLKTISAYLQDAVRAEDTTARLGGDEFTLLLEGLHEIAEATQVAERVTTQLQKPIRLGDREIFASASIGIVYRGATEETTSESLLRDADTAMYHAKMNGKSGYAIFDADMNADVVERLEIETGLRFAIERGELRLHYQPLIDLCSGNMIGIEALIRWEHPIHGLIPPGKFIPLAEETGLIVPIGYWVLEEACRQLQEWKALHLRYDTLQVSVNLSGKQLQRADVVERVRTIIDRTGIEPQYLKLEITESVMMADVDETLAKLHALKAIGVKLAMDDFGTGYSSMSNLNLLPLDTVKIDRSFIQHITDQEETRSIITAIIMLSKALQLDITGEGVETEEQVAYLQGLGCQIGQGYFFSKPLPSTDLEAQMAAGRVYSTDTQGWSKEQIEQFLNAA